MFLTGREDERGRPLGEDEVRRLLRAPAGRARPGTGRCSRCCPGPGCGWPRPRRSTSTTCPPPSAPCRCRPTPAACCSAGLTGVPSTRPPGGASPPCG